MNKIFRKGLDLISGANRKTIYVWTLLRLSMGFILFWAFIDKLIGLGFATAPEKAWLAGGSPAFGFLKFGVTGYFNPIFQPLAGSLIVDVLFMAGLFFIGLALLLNIGVRIAGYAGAILMFLLWLASFPSKNNPLLDNHVVYLLVLLGLTFVRSDKWFSLSKWWTKTSLVKKYPLLK